MILIVISNTNNMLLGLRRRPTGPRGAAAGPVLSYYIMVDAMCPHQTERVRGQSTQSLWRITCPPPEQTPSTCREDPLGQKKRRKMVDAMC